MRASRQLVPSLKYPKCDKKRQHCNEMSSYVCVTAGCRAKGMICTLCKNSEQHKGHQMLPFMTLLDKVDNSLKADKAKHDKRADQGIGKQVVPEVNLPSISPEKRKPLSEINPSAGEISIERRREKDIIFEKLEQIHKQMLGILLLQVQSISKKIQECEEKLVRDYQDTVSRIRSEMEKVETLSSIVQQLREQIVSNNSETGWDLKGNVLRLLSTVSIDKNEIGVKDQSESIFKRYQRFGQTVKENLTLWESDSQSILKTILNKNLQEVLLARDKPRPVTAFEIGSNNAPVPIIPQLFTFAFSPTLKTESMVITNEGKMVKLKDDKHGKLILISQPIPDMKVFIRFKITGLTTNFQTLLGVASKQRVVQNNFKFDKQNNNHGAYLIASNGQQYCSNEPQTLQIPTQFDFKLSDEIRVEADLKNLSVTFLRKRDNFTHVISLAKATDAEQKDLHYCVCINGINDRVQIVGFGKVMDNK